MQSTARATGRSRRGSLITSLVMALLVVAALPLGLVAYQVRLSRESLVEQAQRTHLIAARATADRVQAAMSALASAAAGAAQNPQLYEHPGSRESGEVLAGLLVGEGRPLAAALFNASGGEEALVQMARLPEATDAGVDTLAALGPAIQLQQVAGGLRWGLSQPTARPGLRLAVLADASVLDEILQPRELGPSARLALLQGASPHPALPADGALPPVLLDAMAQPRLDALAVRSDGNAGVEVAAFARIAGTDWAIASLQPAEDAEAAAARMRHGAWIASIAVAVLIGLLSFFAWRRVVQPVRALLEWQRTALTSDGGDGSDLANLRDAFERIQRNQRNRMALGEVFVGRYRLLATLGQGAMGSVFLAWDPRLQRHVAIKTLHLDALDAHQQSVLAEALSAEAVKVAKLQHQNIVGVHDLVSAGEYVFVVMEYVEGGNLRSLIDQLGALEAGEVVLIARAVLSALLIAHRHELLHLDIKPSNLLVSPTGAVKLADFGVSAWRSEVPDLLKREGAAGTPGFIAPEYLGGAAASERSDLFSLGVVLVECMTGVRQKPQAAKAGGLLRAARQVNAQPAATRHEALALWMAVQALCNPDPDLRPASAAAALEMFMQMDASGAEERLAERVRLVAARGPATSGDAPTQRRDLATTQPVPIAPRTASSTRASEPTRVQAWAEPTQAQPWAQATQVQPWAEPAQVQAGQEETVPQPWVRATGADPIDSRNESGLAVDPAGDAAHRAHADPGGLDEVTQPARLIPKPPTRRGPAIDEGRDR